MEPKLRQWLADMDSDDEDDVDGKRRPAAAAASNESLRLVSLEAYNELYHQLKDKYVPELMRVRLAHFLLLRCASFRVLPSFFFFSITFYLHLASWTE